MPNNKFPENNNQDSSDSCKQTGASTIECQNQILGEEVSLTGTPFTLHYSSDRVPSHTAANRLTIPLSGATVPTPLDRIELEVLVAGRRITQSFPPTPDQSTIFTWDGKDGYGRTMQGGHPLTVRIGYHYPAQYFQTPEELKATFGLLSGVPISGSESAPQEGITLWQEHHDTVGAWDTRGLNLGGWSFNIHHAYDPAGQVLYLGNGERRSAQGQNTLVIATVAGRGNVGGPLGDGGPATQAILSGPTDILFAPDGSFFVAEYGGRRIRRVGPDGIITTVAGNGTFGHSGDGGPATQASLANPRHIALGPDGSLYIAEEDPNQGNRIRRVGPDGIITTFAGTGILGFSGDGGPATQASLAIPRGVAVGPDGSVYIAETANRRIRRVGLDGIITTIVGTGEVCFAINQCGDGGPATSAKISQPQDLAFGPDGSLYLLDGSSFVRRVWPDGIITTVAGNGNRCDYQSPLSQTCGDGGPATQAALSAVGITLGPDGSLYIAEFGHFLELSRVRRVSPDGIIAPIAGGNIVPGNSVGDGGPATQAEIRGVSDAAVGPDGFLYRACRRIS